MKNNWKQGSYTVEAAMIMGIILLSIVAVLQGSLFVYKRAVETAKKYEEIIKESEDESDPVKYVRQMQVAQDLLER